MDRGFSNHSLSPRFIVLDQALKSPNVETESNVFDEFKDSLGQQKLNFISFEEHSAEIEEMLSKLAKSINFQTFNVYQFVGLGFSEELIVKLKKTIKDYPQAGNFILFSTKPTITLAENINESAFIQTHSLVSLSTEVSKKKELWGQMKKAFKI